MPFMPSFNLSELTSRLTDVLLRRDVGKLKELVNAAGHEELTHLVDGMSPEQKVRAFRVLAPDRQARLIYDLSDYSQETILLGLSRDELKAMLTAAESDDAVDIIQLLDDSARARMVADLRKEDPKGLLPLLGYGEDSAGGLMKTEMIRVRDDATVDEVRRMLARDHASKRHSFNIYVTDANEALVGWISPMRLLQVPAERPLREVMSPPLAKIPASMDQEHVAVIFDEQNAVELPVIGSRDRLLGVVTADDVFDVMEEEYTEDLSRLVGVDEDDHITDPVMRTVRRRFPWLVVNLGTAVLAATVVGAFQDVIARIVILAAFMPIIAGMGGNAATQTLGVVIRGMALGDVHRSNVRRAIIKEVLAGGLNGFLNGIIMGVVAYAWTKDLTLGVVIAVAMTVNLLVAGLGGVAVPVTLRAMKIDPALASTVFVTTMTDICGFFVFLGLASMFL